MHVTSTLNCESTKAGRYGANIKTFEVKQHDVECLVDLQVFVSSLVPTAPVSLNGSEVLKETLIAHNEVISVGSCNFRFVYRDGYQTSPLQEENRPVSLAGKVR